MHPAIVFPFRFILYGMTTIYVLWILYIAGINLAQARDQGSLNRPAVFIATPVIWIGILVDVFINTVVLTLILLEFPKELTVIARVKRHIRGSGWRQRVAKWFDALFDPF